MSTREQGRQLAFYFDQRYCTACKSCQIACKDLHDLPVGVNWRRVTTYERGQYPHPKVFHLTQSCHHCGRPTCADACPLGAIQKRAEDGIVVLNSALCTGCRLCEAACPYGALQYDATSGAMGKCDFCLDLLARGEKPACVSACTLRVLEYGWLDEMGGEPVRGPALPDPGETEPSMRVRFHRDAK